MTKRPVLKKHTFVYRPDFPFDKAGRPYHYQYYTLLPKYHGIMSVSIHNILILILPVSKTFLIHMPKNIDPWFKIKYFKCSSLFYCEILNPLIHVPQNIEGVLNILQRYFKLDTIFYSDIFNSDSIFYNDYLNQWIQYILQRYFEPIIIQDFF